MVRQSTVLKRHAAPANSGHGLPTLRAYAAHTSFNQRGLKFCPTHVLLVQCTVIKRPPLADAPPPQDHADQMGMPSMPCVSEGDIASAMLSNDRSVAAQSGVVHLTDLARMPPPPPFTHGALGVPLKVAMGSPSGPTEIELAVPFEFALPDRKSVV